MSISDSAAHTSTVEEQACAECHIIMTAFLPGPTLASFRLKSGIQLQKRENSESMILIASVIINFTVQGKLSSKSWH